MIKIANQVIDVSDDIDCSILKKIASKRPNTSVMDSEKRASLNDHEFALVVMTKPNLKRLNLILFLMDLSFQ